jgi:methionyl-tRNA formyltransferase
LRIVFFGTPEFALPTLDAVAAAHEVVLVVAQPDKPAGRGMHMQPPAIAVRAGELGLPLVQPPKIRSPEFLESIAQLQPDIGIVIAYGKILPGSLLAIPRYGFLNVHASILPRYRGAAPIQRAIESGERTTGVTIMRVDEDLDHGPMLAVATTEIAPQERTPSLSKRLAMLGASALLPVLESIGRGLAVETPQEHSQATLAPKIEKREGAIRWSDRASSIYDRFRAFDPWPGLFFTSRGQTIKVTGMTEPQIPGAGRQGSAVGGETIDLRSPISDLRLAIQTEPGTILRIDTAGVVVAAGEGAVRIVEMQRAGKPRAAAADVARGLGWRGGDRLE